MPEPREVCRQCGHSATAHDAAECWRTVNGDQCPCSWYEPGTPETTMRVGDVPAEWIELACEQAYGTPLEPGDDRRSIARAIAVIYPAIEAVVRAKAAEEIRDYAGENGDRYSGAIWEALRLAARIALGDQP